MEVLGGSKNQKSGKCHELPRKSKQHIFFFFKPRWEGVEVLGGSKNQKSGKFHELPTKSIKKFIPPSEDGEREGRAGGRGQGGRKGEGGRQGRRGPSEAG